MLTQPKIRITSFSKHGHISSTQLNDSFFFFCFFYLLMIHLEKLFPADQDSGMFFENMIQTRKII